MPLPLLHASASSALPAAPFPSYYFFWCARHERELREALLSNMQVSLNESLYGIWSALVVVVVVVQINRGFRPFVCTTHCSLYHKFGLSAEICWSLERRPRKKLRSRIPRTPTNPPYIYLQTQAGTFMHTTRRRRRAARPPPTGRC